MLTFSSSASASELLILVRPREKKMDLHRTSKGSHRIMKSTSSSSSSSSTSTSSSSGSVGGHHHHQRAGRQIPVIRVVHIFNPTVIKTDVANFRSLVQELTGRKTESISSSIKLGKSQQSTGNIRRPSSVYDCQMKQLQSTAKDFMSAKPQLLDFEYLSAPPLHRTPSCGAVPTKRTPMYIPERLGTFNDLQEIVSSLHEPLMDFSNLLPPLAEFRNEDSLHAVIPRLPSFYESL